MVDGELTARPPPRRHTCVRVEDIPLPPLLAARPRDPRGYPVLAITPWEDGQPRFAATGTARTYICAVERRCSVCGTSMAAGPVWRVVGGAEAEAIDAAVSAGEPYLNRAATVEAPGHRTCMLYAAVACPYLSRPTARRGIDADLPGLEVRRGERRGIGGALAGFAQMEHRFTDVVLFRFSGLCEFRRHELGTDQLDALLEALADNALPDDAAPTEAPPDYLLADETAAGQRFAALLDGTIV